MTKPSRHGALLPALVVLIALAVAAPAHATLTRAGATGVTARSTDTAFTIGAVRVTCPDTNFRGGSIAVGGGSLSGTIQFDQRPCTDSVFRGSVNVDCNSVFATNDITLTVTNSVAGTSATGVVTLDSTFDCDVSFAGFACELSIVGTQSNYTGWTFTQRDQRLTLNVRTVQVNHDSGGAPCPSSTTAGVLTGTFAVSTPTITVS